MPRIFLSPSTQDWNPYVDGSGSEEYWMNLLADALEPYLYANTIACDCGNSLVNGEAASQGHRRAIAFDVQFAAILNDIALNAGMIDVLQGQHAPVDLNVAADAGPIPTHCGKVQETAVDDELAASCGPTHAGRTVRRGNRTRDSRHIADK